MSSEGEGGPGNGPSATSIKRLDGVLPRCMPQSTITSRGRTTIPKAVRDALRLRAGDRVRYWIQDGAARIRPVRSIERLRGSSKADGRVLSLEQMDCAIVDGVLGSGSAPKPR